jgi:pimeloyl-ACP methyl ester carboxylesterase
VTDAHEWREVVFLPGAAGGADFWQPVSDLLPAHWRKTYWHWTGADPRVTSFGDAAALLAGELQPGSDLVAQSLGGAVALELALRHPDKVRRLVLVATSGGLDVGSLGGADWREAYTRSFTDAPSWITSERPDHTAELATVGAPTLLLWGDADPISPVSVGRALAALLPRATLHVVPGGTHSLGRDRAAEIAPLVAAHLA